MRAKSSTKFLGKFFFTRLKKKDKFYFKRINQRYKDLRENVKKTSLLSEQEMFQAYLDLMDILLQMHSKEGM
jgi:hypothetical protein